MHNSAAESPVVRTGKIRLHKVLVAASLFVPLTLFAVIMWQDYRILLHDHEQGALQTTSIFQQHATNVFETHELIAELVDIRVRGLTWNEIERSKEIRAYLAEIRDAYPQVLGIFLADSSGMLRNGSQPLPGPPVNIADRDYFQTLRQRDAGLFVGKIVRGRVLDSYNFHVARRRESKAGTFAGIIIINISPQYFTDFWKKTAQEPDSATSLLRSDGSFLARAPRINLDRLTAPPDSEVAQAIRRGKDGSYTAESVSDGTKRFNGIRKVGKYNVFIVHGFALKTVLQDWRKDLVFYGGIFGAATAALLVLSLLALRRAQEESRAIRRLQDSAKQLEEKGEKLNTTMRRLELAVSSGQLGVWDWNIKANALVWDDRMFELYGVSKEAFPGELEAWENGLHPADRAAAKEEIQAALRGEKEFDTEFRVVHPDGTVKNIKGNGLVHRDADGHAIRMIGINRDITEQKRGEEELTAYRRGLEELVEKRAAAVIAANEQLQKEIGERRQAEEMLRRMGNYNRTLIETSLDPLVTIDISGKITDVNRATEMATGCTRGELIGSDFSNYFMGQEKARSGYELVFREGVVQDYELEIRRRDGHVTPVLYNASVYRDESGNILGVFAAARDITERKRAEEEHRRLEEKVRHTQKLESLGILAGGIAHDFNNLLTVILGNIELALSKLSPVSPARDLLVEVGKASNRAADLCRQMLAYSGKGRFVVESLDLSEVAREMAHILEISISKKAALRYRLAPDLPSVEADASQIQQVVMNLIINASDAIGDSPGEIILATGAMNCDRSYLREIWPEEELPEGSYVFIEVTDTGCGMDEATRKKIFDPFFTTKFTGRGLGLSAVHGIVRGHKGAIKIYSEVGKGTTFKVLFPAGRNAALSAAAEPAIEGWKGAGTVLVADDEEMVRQVVVSMLESLGFRVLTAVDGQEALEVFAAHRDEIGCVLLDLTMPRMDGEEAFRKMRLLHPGVRVILTSGYNEQRITRRFVGKGLAGFVQKPYKMSELAVKLREVFAKTASGP